MRQVELHAPEEIRLIETPRPQPGPQEVLIAVAEVGICGSDLHAYHGKHPFITLPVVPGHEFAGLVAEVGAEVTDFAPGDRVTVEPSLVCGECYNCRHGRYNICSNLRVIGCQTPGAMAETIAVPTEKVLRLPDGVSWVQGALAEPLAVGVRAARRAEFEPGANVMILGGGTIGLMTLQAAKALGAGTVMVSELLPERLALAKELGADVLVNPGETDLLDAVEETFGERRADVIIECVGIGATVREAIRVARKGTRIVIAGVFEQDISVSMGLVQDHELELIGTLMYVDDDFPTALRLLAEGQARAEPLVSHRFPLEEAAEAFAVADERQGALKVLIDVWTEEEQAVGR
ncbi:MAG: zinc-dependent alcohol dehydrogenase [Anaerolineae bacterium]